MIRTVLTLATALSVLWHAAAGCCAHHDHSDTPTASAPATVSAPTKVAHQSSQPCGGCRCRKHARAVSTTTIAHHPSSNKSVSPAIALKHGGSGPEHHCDGQRCSFAAVKTTSAANLLRHVTPLAGELIATETVAASTEATRRDLRRSLDDRPPPLRTHLALRVLLI